MMDDLASKNPEEYQKFVAKQMKDKEKYDKANEPPAPIFGARFKNSADGGALVWLNVCSSTRVTAPEGPNADIPVVVLEPTLQPVNNGGGRATLYDAVLHPTVFDRMDSDAAFKSELIKVVLGCVEQRSEQLDEWADVTVDHTTVRVRDTPYKKKTMKEKLEQAAAQMKQPFEMQMPGGGGGGGAAAGPAKPEVVMPTPSNPAGGGGGASAGETAPTIVIPGLGAAAPPPTATATPTAFAPTELPDRRPAVRIEELASTATAQTGAAEGMTVPSHSCVHDETAAALSVTVDLPGVRTVAQIVLEVERRKITLTAEGGYALELPLPRAVDIDAPVAKFRKKREQLLLTLPLAN